MHVDHLQDLLRADAIPSDAIHDLRWTDVDWDGSRIRLRGPCATRCAVGIFLGLTHTTRDRCATLSAHSLRALASTRERGISQRVRDGRSWWDSDPIFDPATSTPIAR